MTQNFADRLIEAIERKKSVVVVGLDPRADSLPPDLREQAARSSADTAEAFRRFNDGILDAIAPHAVAVKPQSAFYEALGWEGVRAYAQTIRAARERGLLVIGDVKRGDIGSTAEAYAEGHLDLFDADAITVNPWLGTDSIAPFLKRTAKEKGIFVLVKTSNPSSAELQDVVVAGETMSEHVARLVNQWGAGSIGQRGYSAVGAVVGATFPESVARMRQAMPHAIFLLPGYGAQGATAQDCRPCFDANGLGAVVNSSRGIIFAFAKDPSPDWRAPIAQAAQRMQAELEAVRGRSPQR